jgi:hypothetical protein
VKQWRPLHTSLHHRLSFKACSGSGDRAHQVAWAGPTGCRGSVIAARVAKMLWLANKNRDRVGWPPDPALHDLQQGTRYRSIFTQSRIECRSRRRAAQVKAESPFGLQDAFPEVRGTKYCGSRRSKSTVRRRQRGRLNALPQAERDRKQAVYVCGVVCVLAQAD